MRISIILSNFHPIPMSTACAACVCSPLPPACGALLWLSGSIRKAAQSKPSGREKRRHRKRTGMQEGESKRRMSCALLAGRAWRRSPRTAAAEAAQSARLRPEKILPTATSALRVTMQANVQTATRDAWRVLDGCSHRCYCRRGCCGLMPEDCRWLRRKRSLTAALSCAVLGLIDCVVLFLFCFSVATVFNLPPSSSSFRHGDRQREMGQRELRSRQRGFDIGDLPSAAVLFDQRPSRATETHVQGQDDQRRLRRCWAEGR
jgi:hypothetical protein